MATKMMVEVKRDEIKVAARDHWSVPLAESASRFSFSIGFFRDHHTHITHTTTTC